MEKVWLSDTKEVAEIIDTREEWTSYPHGSGAYYDVHTVRRQDGKIFSYESGSDRSNMVLSKGYLLAHNRGLEEKIQRMKNEIEENCKIIALLDK